MLLKFQSKGYPKYVDNKKLLEALNVHITHKTYYAFFNNLSILSLIDKAIQNFIIVTYCGRYKRFLVGHN